jgi:ATP-binding cassette, subfamily B (MDR/TAP), member 1
MFSYRNCSALIKLSLFLLLFPSGSVVFSVVIVSTIMGSIVIPVLQAIKAITSSQSFFDLIDTPALSDKGIKEPEVTAHADIEFREVCFAYPSRPGIPILKNFNARIEKGKTTALVGPSGSGKSTVVALLERWYQVGDAAEEVAVLQKNKVISENDNKEENNANDEESRSTNRTSGAIYVDGHDINTLDRKWWRAQIGLVQQEPFLFNDTISNNIAFGLIGSQWEYASDEEKRGLVESACKEAFADEFIRRLPKASLATLSNLIKWREKKEKKKIN